MSNLKNTIGNVKQLLGRNWSDPKLQADLKTLGVCNEFVELPGDRVGVKVQYRGETTVFAPEQLAGMLFAKLRQTTESATKVKVKDAVVSVPGWFNEAQRRALLDSIHLGGINPLKIVNDLAAVSLSWGFFKTELDEKTPIKVMFVDIGEHAMSVAITEFTKSQAKIVSTAYDTSVSGSAINIALATHFAQEFLEKKKVDLRQNPKAWFRLIQAVGRVKKILNTNPQAPLNIECIDGENDIAATITRDVFAELVKGVVAQVPNALDAALRRINVTADQLHAIELVGSASRTTLFQHAIAAHLKRDTSTTLNAEEACAKGCALQCAILSPHFRTREYSIVDVVDHPVVCTWQTINDPNDTDKRRVVIFDRTSSFPAAKNVNFHRSECKPFEVKIHYDTTGDHAVEGCVQPLLSTVTIQSIPKPAEGQDADIRIKIRKNTNGIVEAVDCELVEKYEEAETPAAMDVDAKADSPAPAADGSSPAPAADAAPAAAAAAEPVKKKKVRYTPVPFKVKTETGNSAATIAEWAKIEAKIDEESRLAVAVADAKNAVESYIYDARDKLYAQWAPYVSESDASAFNSLLDEIGDWLYGEGEDQTREVYEQKLAQLKALGDPLDFRKSEHAARDEIINHFHATHDDYHGRATEASEKYDHIAPEEKAKIVAEVEKNRAWLAPLVEKQKAQSLTSDPILHSREIKQRSEALAKLAHPILNKPKPKPAPTPKAEEKPATATPETTPAADASNDASPAPETATPEAENKMDVDN